MDALDALIKQNQLSPPEQKTAYDQLKGAQEKLESEYMQAKEDDNARRRRNSIFNNGDEDLFDPEREVEGQIFQLGMRLDDIHGDVMVCTGNDRCKICTPIINSKFEKEEYNFLVVISFPCRNTISELVLVLLSIIQIVNCQDINGSSEMSILKTAVSTTNDIAPIVEKQAENDEKLCAYQSIITQKSSLIGRDA